jgi:hypothetical protein
LRGGPSFIDPGNQSISLNVSTDQTKKLRFYAGNYQGSGDAKSFRGGNVTLFRLFYPTNPDE